MTVAFHLAGTDFVALNGGPEFAFTPAVSFMVTCDSAEEVDLLWERLCDGGEPSQCGWLRDRFGLSWQIVPRGLSEVLGGDDPAGAERAMRAMLGMSKLDLAVLRAAYAETA